MCEAIKTLTDTFTNQRRLQLLFFEKGTSNEYLRKFEKRHKIELKFNRTTPQEAKRHIAVNAETVATHFATHRNIMDTNNIDSTRISNLDETGCSPGKESISKARRYTRRSTESDIKMPKFENDARITMLAVVNAEGDTVLPLFAFSGSRMPFRNIIVDGQVVVNTYSSHLPHHSFVAMRPEGIGVDAMNFLDWAQHFVEHVQDLTQNGLKLLLTFNGYRSHMTLPVLDLFAKNNIIVYCLPAYTSVKLQPLDLVVFASFKNSLSENIYSTVKPNEEDTITTYEYCDFMRRAYHSSFTRQNVVSSFRRAGLWSLVPKRLATAPLRRNVNDGGTLIAADALMSLYEHKRNEIRKGILGSEVKILSCDNIDTTRGAVLTSKEAMNVARQKQEEVQQKRRIAVLAAARRELSAINRTKKYFSEIYRLREASITTRAQLAKMDREDFIRKCRSLKERRAVARIRSELRRLKFAGCGGSVMTA